MGLIRQKKFRNKLLLSMAAIAFFPIFVIGTISSMLSESVIRENYIRSQENSLSTANEFIDNVLRGMIRSSRNVLANETVMGILEGEEGYTPGNRNILDGEMSLLFFDNPDLESVFLMNMEGEIYYYGRGGYSYRMAEGVSVKSVSGEEWYIRAMEANGREVFAGYDVIAGGDSGKISCIKKMRSLRHMSKDGMEGLLILNVESERLFESFSSNTDQMSSSVVYDDGSPGRPLVFERGGESGEVRELLRQYDSGDGGSGIRADYVISEVKNETTGWRLINVIAKEDLLRDAGWLQWAILAVSGATGLIMAFCFVLLTRSLYRPLQQLEESIALAAVSPKEALAREQNYADDEIGRIGMKFRDMLQKNLALNERIVTQEVWQKNAQIQELQAKINPHFLYNILDCVSWMIRMGRNDDAAEMVVKLSRIMRNSLNQGRQMTTLEKEFLLLQDYLFLQNMRYDNQFEIRVTLEESLKEVAILGLLLQPFVENAMVHGLSQRQEGGYVHVTGTKEEGWIVIVIEDNGCGMDEKTLNAPGYGIRNVKKRLELFYGEKHRLAITSAPGEGTKVTLRLARTLGKGVRACTG